MAHLAGFSAPRIRLSRHSGADHPCRPDGRRASRHPDVLLFQIRRCFAAFSVLGHARFFGELRPSPDALLRCHPSAVDVDRRVSISTRWRFVRQARKAVLFRPIH